MGEDFTMKSRALILVVIGICCFAAPVAVQAGWFTSSVNKAIAEKAAINAAEKRVVSSVNKPLVKKAAVNVEEKRLVYLQAKRAREQGKISDKAFSRKVEKFDRSRDLNLPVKPMRDSRMVSRYTSMKQAKIGQVNGLAPNTHMTSKAIVPGRPLSQATAKDRYGLKNEPEAVMTVRIPRDQPVRKGKVIAGSPGYGEITSTKRIAPENILAVRPVP